MAWHYKHYKRAQTPWIVRVIPQRNQPREQQAAFCEEIAIECPLETFVD